LNWKDEVEERGTASLAAKTKKSCEKMEIVLKLMNKEMIVKTEESEFQTKTAVRIGFFLS
jgi:hypothetical protein